MRVPKMYKNASGRTVLLAGAFAVALLAGGLWAGAVGGPGQARFTLSEKQGRYTLHADQAPVKDVLRELGAVAGIRLTIDGKLQDQITVDLKDVTAEEMLKALTKSGSFVYAKDGQGGFKLVSASATSQQQAAPIQPAQRVGQGALDKPVTLAKGQLSNVQKPLASMLTRDAKSILLENAIIDSEALRSGSTLNIPDALRSKAGERNYIVQFDHLVSAQDKAAVANAGGTVGHYIPNNALFVRVGSAAALAALQKLPGVSVVEPYQPYFKLSRDLVAYETGQADAQEKSRAQIGSYTVMFTHDQVDVGSSLKLPADSVVREASASGRKVASVKAPVTEVAAMAANTDVLWIEPAMPLQPMNDLGDRRIRGARFKKLHPSLKGEGVIVGVTDTGVDYQHAGFSLNQSLPTSTNLNTRILDYFYAGGGPTSDGLPGDTVGHGTHVAGSILGNGALSRSVNKAPGSGAALYPTNQFAGVAPGARLVMVEDFNSYSYQEQLTLQYNSGARMNNNSWGANVFQYSASSAIWDGLVQDMDANAPGKQQFISFFAAGNSGNGNDNGLGGVAGTVGSPGNAKNVITVGAVEQARFAENYPNARGETDSDWQIASYSSRGPVSPTDSRRKPDIVAPGSYVLSIQSRDTNPDELIDPVLPDRDYRYGNLDSGTNYAFLSGTSMATPLSTGAGALLYEYFTNRFSRVPSPAMMKAMMINGARNINSIVYPKQSGPFVPNAVYMESPVYQGYGLLDVVRSADGPQVHSTDQTVLLDEDETTPLSTGVTYTYPIVVNQGEGGLKVTLAYTDEAGTPGNARALVNDLDVFVIAPNGVSYLGNVFSFDGVHSMPVSGITTIGADGFNNVEQVIIPEALPGTYYVRVFAWNVPVGTQPFALSILKGIGIEGRVPGNAPSVALDAEGNPVIAYSGPDTGGNEQVFVRKWVGPIGDASSFGSWLRLEDQWYGLRDSANRAGQSSSNGATTGISRSLEPSRNPSVAVDGINTFVAWEEYGQTANTPSKIFLRQFNGSDWIELSNSARGNGIASSAFSFDALDPVVRVQQQHLPVVAWRQNVATGTKILVALHDGINWVGLGGSNLSNGIPGVTYAANLDMTIDSLGAIVVAWEEQQDQRIHIRRWANNTWADLGTQGSAPYAASPRLAADANGGIYLTWVQYPSGAGTNFFTQIYASKYSGGWQQFGGSTNYPGISQNFNATNGNLATPSISIGRNSEVLVSWVAGDDPENSVLVKRFSGGQWQGLAGAGAPPGVAFNNGTSTNSTMACDTNGIPFVVFANNGSGESEIMTYALSSDRSAPSFLGIQTAKGNTNGGVVVGWLPATDFSSNITYRIYRSTTSVPCGTAPNCDANNVFGNLIAVVTNQVDLAVGGVTNGRIYCFGVRAVDENGFSDQNTAMLAAGPAGTGGGDDDADCLINSVELLVDTDTCLKDTDGDGMWDGWEWTFSTNNPAHTNALAMIPINNGLDNVRTITPGDGIAGQGPLDDPDGDGLANLEEFNWWLTHGATCPVSRANSPDPTRADTDGDGMMDGWEVQHGLSPVSTNGVDGPTGDPDGDGVINIVEYQYGSNPLVSDTDGDGLTDSNEVFNVLSDPISVDSDLDGLDDPFEAAHVADGFLAYRADSGTNSLLSDGDVWQLGWTNRATAVTFDFLVREDFETASRTNWTHNAPNALLPYDMWHLSATDPAPAPTNRPVRITFMHQRTTNVAYRMANDPSATPSVPGTNLAATYNRASLIQCALNSPVFDALTNTCLFVQWNEYFETEPFWDTVQVQARAAGNTNWVTFGQQFSGHSIATNQETRASTNGWVHRIADLSRFAGQSGVQVRFLFSAQNNINNNFRGWWVDDVYVYGGVVVSGWVRDVRGRPVDGGQVAAIGLGGVTNLIDGHKVAGLGKIFGTAKTAADGSYQLSGLPHGMLLLKASSASLAAEFYNGPLFAGTYAFAAGITSNFGLADADLAKASPNGLLDLRTTTLLSSAHFELEQGRGRAYVGVAGPASTVKYDHLTINRWNGSTSAPAFIVWTSAASTATFVNNRPDWETAPAAPNLFGDAAPGTHWLYPAISQRVPPSVVDVREGENTLVQFSTNQLAASLFVSSQIGGAYTVWMDGTLTTSSVPAVVSVKAGTHYVTLVPTAQSGAPRPGVKKIYAKAGALQTRLLFDTNDLSLFPATLLVQSVDIHGNIVSGAQVVVNGSVVSSNDVLTGSSLTTPTAVRGLLPGDHYVSITAPGYRPSEMRTVSMFSGATNGLVFTLYDADRDYDLVGDATEISGYTNVFLYSRSNDPDVDGLSNLQEFDLFREFNVRVNPFNQDTDGDGMTDGAEVAYDGMAGRLAISLLATNVAQDSSWAAVFFSGKYLAGIDYFRQSNAIASIEGDRFESPVVRHPNLPVPTRQWAQSIFTNIAPLVKERAISEGHNPESIVFSDTRPDRADTDGDGMWDGFESSFTTMTSLADPNSTIRILDPIEKGNADGDPDADGLTNYQEFLGPDGVTNLVWSDPTKSDSDSDGIPDGWETTYGLDPGNADDAGEDPDGDGLINVGEYLSGTNPNIPDTDADFLPDGMEVLVFGADPRNADTDSDGLMDGREVWDKDMDGTPDGGFFPMWNGGDLDGDGIVDGPTDWDTDGDGMPDGFEVLNNFGIIRSQTLDPYNPFDGLIDSDNDGLSNLQEFLVKDALYGHPPFEFDPVGHSLVIWQYSTDPFQADSDNDGMPDGFEVLFGLGPVDPSPNSSGSSVVLYPDLLPEGDVDQDGLWNDREYRVRFHLDALSPINPAVSLSTSPWNADTDGDGLGDGEEDRVFKSHPIVQDSDADQLTDGVSVPGRMAEVETVVRRSEFTNITGSVFWPQANDLSRIPHPVYPWIFGHLASLEDSNEVADAIAALNGANNVAIGGYADFAETGIHWLTFENPPPPGGLATPLPAPLSFTQTNFYMLNADGTLSATLDFAPGGYLVEWEDVPQTDAHYDGGTNDLWVLGAVRNITNPDEPLMPVWAQITPDDDGGTLQIPPSRWSQTAVYIPQVERKSSQNLKQQPIGASLLDNRKIVVFGGSGGVTRYKDVWEYWLYDNRWHKGTAPLNSEAGAATPPGLNFLPPTYSSGLSEAAAFTRHINLRTTTIPDPIWINPDCPCSDVPYACNGQGFGEPKNRPWIGGGILDRSFDLTYLFDGFDTAHLYHSGAAGYKATDDPRPMVENSAEWDSAAYEYIQTTDGRPTGRVDADPIGIRIGNGPPVLQAGTTNVLGTLDGFAGFTFQPMPFFNSCEDILQVTLHLRVRNRYATDINVNMGLEFGSVSAYNNPLPGDRWPPGSNIIPLTIPANANNTQLIDITEEFVQVLTDAAWQGLPTVMRMGVLFNDPTVNPNAYAEIFKTGSGNARTFITVTYRPQWKLNPNWADILFALPGQNNESAGIPTNAPGSHTVSITASNVSPKAVGLAYDYTRDRYLVFGGIDGRSVNGDTWENQLNPQSVYWSLTQSTLITGVTPPARWGHSLVYDKAHDWYVMFGGFDREHKPLNDLWLYVPAAVNGAGSWVEVPRQSLIDQWPSPRGGHSMIYWGDFDWNAGIGNYTIAYNNLQRELLFGGTDGKSFFNDTWLFNGDTLKWTLVNPSGIWGGATPVPAPRAFHSMVYAQNGLRANPLVSENVPDDGARAAAYLFGGHVGTLPTGKDSDFDLVDDGVEHALNGASQRDPRVNRTFLPFDARPETLPYNFARIGSVPLDWNPLSPNFNTRGALADFESLNHEDRAYLQAIIPPILLPYESHTLLGRTNQILTFYPNTYVTTDPGVDANAVQQTQLWWHQHAGENLFDPRDVWELGAPEPSTAGTNAVPQAAYSGRWCYGTKLNGFYPNDANMELYSPLVNLAMPVTDSTSASPNFNEFYLVFHEWLNLGDSNDTVRVEMLRPATGSDILSRKTGVSKPVIRVLPDRNNAYNTKGEWRRMIVPVTVAANETNFYFRFVLQSDGSSVAGGWYLDDVAVIQGGSMSGVLTNLPNGEVVLLGINSVGSIYTNTLTDASGFFQFGLLPDGDYKIGSGGGIIGQFSVGDFNGWNNNIGTTVAPQVTISSIAPNPGGGMAITWPTTPGLTYRLEYSDNGMGGPYLPLVTLTAASEQETYIDYAGTGLRFYRVVFLNNL